MSRLLDRIQERVVKTYTGQTVDCPNPMPFLLEKGWLSSVGPGLYVFRGPLVPLLNKIENLFSQLAADLNAEEIWVPSFLSKENAERSQYLNSFSSQALVLGGNAANVLEGLACPTVCYHYFASLSKQRAELPQLITSLGKCSRRENSGLGDLGRLQNFTMRELVGLGSTEYCKKMLQEIQKRVTGIFETVFDLSYSVCTASDPFFGDESETKKKAQLLSESKFEVQMPLPFKSQSISTASFNLHGNVFYDRFQIQPSEPQNYESFCVGFGYERILFSLLSQKGTDFSTPFYKNFLKQ